MERRRKSGTTTATSPSPRSSCSLPRHIGKTSKSIRESGFRCGLPPIPATTIGSCAARGRRGGRVLADRQAEVFPRVMENELPPLMSMWARWAVVAAAFVACGSERGPRVAPSACSFDTSRHDGSSLYLLADGRAVLSGGVWNSPTLAAVYNHGAVMPKLFEGAPEWVAESVVNARAARGLLSFCYWWDAQRWFRGESPPAADCASAMPGVWTADTTASIVAGSVSEHPGDHVRAAAIALVSAAQRGAVDREMVARVFDDGRFDIDGGLHQLMLAGLVPRERRRMPAAEAIARMSRFLADRNSDTIGYRVPELAADRFSIGWTVYVPVPAGEVVIDRTAFCLDDDGFLEQSSSPPSEVIENVERRYWDRHGGSMEDVAAQRLISGSGFGSGRDAR